jgi:methionyl-tRNA formyltransferase
MKIVFLGRKEYAAKMLSWTAIDMKQTIVGVVADGNYTDTFPLIETAKRLNVPIMSYQEIEKRIAENNAYADLIVSYLYPQKIREPLISCPKNGCINFHPALLPAWKGVGGYNIAILYKLKEWGASAHYVDEYIDTGKIIRVYRFNFDYRHETAKSLEQKTQNILWDLYKSVMADIISGSLREEDLIQNIGGTYISKKELRAMMPVNPQIDDIDLKCRAFWFPPYSGATIELQGKKYTLVDDLILSQLKNGL